MLTVATRRAPRPIMAEICVFILTLPPGPTGKSGLRRCHLRAAVTSALAPGLVLLSILCRILSQVPPAPVLFLLPTIVALSAPAPITPKILRSGPGPARVPGADQVCPARKTNLQSPAPVFFLLPTIVALSAPAPITPKILRSGPGPARVPVEDQVCHVWKINRFPLAIFL